MNILATLTATALLALLVFGKRYARRLEFSGGFIQVTVMLWPALGVFLAVTSQCLLYAVHNQLLTAIVDGAALLGAYIELCRR